jgi:diguanylate cyclase (GGDEF)-like protein
MSANRFSRLRLYGPIALALLIFSASYLVYSQRLREANQQVLLSVSEATWMASQAEFELQRFLVAVGDHTAGRGGVDREQLVERLELLWSRLPVLVEGEDSRFVRERTNIEAIVADLEADLRAIERLLADGVGGIELRDAVDTRLRPHVAPLHDVSLHINKIAAELHFDLQRRIGLLAQNHLVALAGILGSVAILVLLLVREVRRTQRLLAEARQARQRIEHLAHHDTLTALPNRRLFQDRLEQALARWRRHGDGLALHLIDLDRFKEVNDSFGHAAGDALLREAGQRMRACLRDADTLARFGGDEFAVVQIDVNRSSDAASLAERLCEALRAPMQLGGQSVRPSGSVGIALVPNDGAEAATLLRHADLALYRSKSDGRDRYAFYAAEMDRANRDRRRLLADLAAALEEGQLAVHYQLRFAADGRATCAEALLRWAHPERGTLPASSFVPLAEESGLIVPLGGWVIETACRDCHGWRHGGDGLRLRVAVNLSPVQLDRDDVLGRAERALAATGLLPTDLEVEIAEGPLLAGDPRLLERLGALRARGVRVLLDDFGLGRSSLGALREMPLDGVKIAVALARTVTEPRGAAFYAGLTALARGLGLEVVGEGAESAAQVEAMRRLGCDQVQGFHLAPPEPAPAIAARLARRRASTVGPA